MFAVRRLSVVVVILTCFLHAQGADKYTDENRPYEFGFNIDGEQHRHEKKGENGLIEGEFGFITADGVYHVTVYATDENGNFKILSMKNIRVKPYPTAPEKKGHSLPFPPSENQPVAQAPASVEIEQPARSCSHCSIPTTPKAPELSDIAVVYTDQQNQPPQPSDAVYPNNPAENDPSYPNYPNDPNYPAQPDYNEVPGSENIRFDPRVSEGERNPKKLENYPEGNAAVQPGQTPQLISAQMKIVDENTDINALRPGEQPGLPNGVTTGQMKFLLYTFNYTVGFHGHHEEGYSDGSKKGYYYVTGRNGVKQRVDYEADEKGFRPKITQELLDVLSEDVPKPETEKDEKYGLKFYEFKWLYYPSDENSP